MSNTSQLEVHEWKEKAMLSIEEKYHFVKENESSDTSGFQR